MAGVLVSGNIKPDQGKMIPAVLAEIFRRKFQSGVKAIGGVKTLNLLPVLLQL
jgi:hypothetical protein